MLGESLVFQRATDGALVAPPQCGLLAVPDFLREVQRRAEQGTAVVVDLGRVEVFDPTVIRALVWARRFCLWREVHFAVVEPPPGVLAQREAAVIRRVLPLHADRDAATAAAVDRQSVRPPLPRARDQSPG